MDTIKISAGIEIAAQVAGPANAPLVVCIHGHTGSHGRYVFFQERLQDRYRVLVYDHRGHGDSTKPEAPTEPENRSLYSMDRLADDLHELLDALGCAGRKVVLVGHSMGGRVAFTYYLRHPERVAGIVAISTNLGYTAAGKEVMARLVDGYKRDPSTWNRGSLLEGSLKIAYSRRYFKENAEKMGIEADRRMKTSKVAMIYTLEDFAVRQDLIPRAGDIKVPVLVVHGTSDGVIAWQSGKLIADSVPGATSTFIERGSHQITEENKEAVLQGIVDFLKRVTM
ncbi:MAG: alpha/beta hydrolase [Candidatus Lokiarchaeota archaeon]|nr:alpha/beta hydrolase [Candidatus Lokiarchaeota archaeon]